MKRSIRTLCSIALVGAFAFASMASGSSDSEEPTVKKTDSTTEAESEAPEETEDALDLSNGYGLTITFDDLEITFPDSVEWTTVDNQFADTNGQDIIALTMHVENIDDENHGLNMFYLKIFGTQGTELDDQGAYFEGNTLLSSGDMRPGASQDITLYFPYDGDGTYYLNFDNMFDTIEVGFPVTK